MGALRVLLLLAVGLVDEQALNRRVAEAPDPRDILNQVIRDILANPDLEEHLKTCGTHRSKTVALVQEPGVPWLIDWRPEIPGYEVIRFRTPHTCVRKLLYQHVPAGDHFVEFIRRWSSPLLGIRVEALLLEPERQWKHVRVSLFNFGGDGGQSDRINAGCFVHYAIVRSGGKWRVACTMIVEIDG